MRRLKLAWAIVCSLASTECIAEQRALLVGVSDYDNSFGITDLNGPSNDVRLMSEVLTGFGFEDVTILSSDMDDTNQPTRSAIMGALATLADRSEEGDFIYVHLSGHGTQQQDPEGEESDGLDEVFLPADTGRSEPGSGLWPNAIVDDDLGAAISVFRAKGVNVWLVMATRKMRTRPNMSRIWFSQNIALMMNDSSWP